MKIRSGFVSNSSSASYIVNIKMDIEDLMPLMMDECWGFFDVESIEESIKEKIAIWSDGSACSHSKEVIEKLESKLQDLKRFEKGTSELFFAILDYWGITCNLNDGVTLSGWTSMHNSYDDMPGILKQICIFMMFERPDKISVKVEHDS